jgi:hypothetical protein
MGTSAEIPQRLATFYTADLTGATITELPANFGMKYGIEAIVGPPPANDAGVTAITAPISTCATLSATEDIVVTIKNYGTSAISGFPVSYKINNNAPVTVNYTASIAGGATASYTFTGANAANLSAPGFYTIKAYTSLTGDATHTNDTTTVYLTVGTATVPYFMGFEATDNLLGWSVIDANSDLYTWNIYTSAKYAHTGDGFAAYDYNLDATTAADDWLFTKCISLSSGNSYQLKFYYRALDIAWEEAMNVNIGTVNSVAGMTTQLVDLPSITDTTYPSSTTIFTVPSTGTYYIGFHCKSLANKDLLLIDDISIDLITGVAENSVQDISVYPNPANDKLFILSDNIKNVEIFNLLGKVVFETETINPNGSIDIANLPKGTYIVRITKDNSVISKKINIIR